MGDQMEVDSPGQNSAKRPAEGAEASEASKPKRIKVMIALRNGNLITILTDPGS